MSEHDAERARETVGAVYRAESRRVLATLIRQLCACSARAASSECALTSSATGSGTTIRFPACWSRFNRPARASTISRDALERPAPAAAAGPQAGPRQRSWRRAMSSSPTGCATSSRRAAARPRRSAMRPRAKGSARVAGPKRCFSAFTVAERPGNAR